MSGKWVGRRLPRKEDARFTSGRALYTPDIRRPGMLHVALVRSPHAHARIGAVRGPAALTGAEVARLCRPFDQPAAYSGLLDYCLAVGSARYYGEPVAAVLGDSPYEAADLAEQVDVEYEPLDPVLDPFSAHRAPPIHPGLASNRVWHQVFDFGDVGAAFSAADHVVRERLRFHRFTSAPLECHAVVAEYEPQADSFTVWSADQRPMFNRTFVAGALRHPQDRFHWICPDVGGGFGIKSNTYVYMVLACLLARKSGRPVRFVEQRQEYFLSGPHGNEMYYDAELAVRRDGEVLALRCRCLLDEGAFMRREPVGGLNFMRHATVGYRFRNLRMELDAVLTNKCAIGPNRSYGKMQQCFLVERLLDRAAAELGLGRAQIRRRNFVRREEMPWETPTGAVLDGGDYGAALDRACDLIDLPAWRRRQAAARAEGRLIGIGFGLGMDACPMSASILRLVDPDRPISGDSEAAWVRMDQDGRVSVATGLVPQGQGHETAVAQLVADELGVTPEDVTVLAGFDSATHPFTALSGTYASRFAVVGVGAVLGAARQVADRLRRIAAHRLEARAEDVELEDGQARVRGTGHVLSLQALAATAWRDLARLPEGMEAGLFAHHAYRAPFGLPGPDGRGNYSLTYSYGVSVVVVEVDRGTGRARVLDIAAVDDCGKRINPLLVDGQVHGAILAQLAGALFEKCDYTADGLPTATSFMDYWAPTALDLPGYRVDYIETPSSAVPFGARGVGEGGGSPLIACISAVEDALRPVGGRVRASHVTPEEILRQIRAASG